MPDTAKKRDLIADLTKQLQEVPALPAIPALTINMGGGGNMTLVFSGGVSTTIVQGKP